MPDEWELKFKLNPQDAADAAQDKDKDGYTNVEEYLNGTDPTVFVDYTKPENNHQHPEVAAMIKARHPSSPRVGRSAASPRWPLPTSRA